MKNESGIQPLEYKCLVYIPETEEKSKGGIHLPNMVRDKEQQGCMKGLFVAKGPIAFTDPEWELEPQPGDYVLFDRYAGKMVTGADGKKYRVMSDKEIGALADERVND